MKTMVKQKVNIKGLYLNSLSIATNRDCFATENDDCELINQNGNLRLLIKKTGYISKTYVNMNEQFGISILIKANSEFIAQNMEASKWRQWFKVTDLQVIINNVNWCGLSPVLQLLKDIVQYENDEIQLEWSKTQ